MYKMSVNDGIVDNDVLPPNMSQLTIGEADKDFNHFYFILHILKLCDPHKKRDMCKTIYLATSNFCSEYMWM